MNKKLINLSLSLSLTSFIILSSCAISPNTATTNTEIKTDASPSPSPLTIPENEKKPQPYINPGDGNSTSKYLSKPKSSDYYSDDSGIAVPADSAAEYDSAVPGEAVSAPEPVPQSKYKSLTAGNIDDNADFTSYLSYLEKLNPRLTDKLDVLKADSSERYIISVSDQDSRPVSDAVIEINGFRAKTYANGKSIFFPMLIPSNLSDCQQQGCSDKNFDITVKKDGIIKTESFSRENKNWDIKLEMKNQIPDNPNLDIVFLVDATGSMSDEISSIQQTIKSISSRIHAFDKSPKLRYSLVSYRDRSDDYRVKRYDFTSNLDFFQEILDELSADGGGDYKESMNEGLHHAIQEISWTEQEDALRLVFLIADAPPHLDYSDDYKYIDEAFKAVEKGIKIYPVAASGLDDAGEYVFRQLALFTSAKFLFITYGGDEQNKGTTPHHVGEFNENNLDDLIVNIVKEEIESLD